ncbi:MAG: MltA domain-containing protein [Saprospiraceae bacterium]|nr:MltA domain-containing protein [Saprospiraceae bacterium]
MKNELQSFSPSLMLLSRRIVILDLLLLITCFSIYWLDTTPPNPNLVESGLGIPFRFPAKDEAPAERPAAAPESTGAVEVETSAATTSERKLSSSILISGHPDTIPYLSFDPDMLKAMYEQANYLRRADVKKHTRSGISKNEMLRTVELLQNVQLLDPSVLLTTFDFYGINTDLKKDRVRMTGYYTPVIEASRVRTDEFPVPMYKRPDSNVPNPAAIEAGALSGRNMELAWVASKKALANAQLQGNCLVEFPDGKRQHFGFGGSVKGKGGRYVFFTPVDDKVLGCGFFPLTAGYSVAVDPRYIPIGSTLLAELPDIDASGKLKGYTYRIIFAQDRGGAILTTKRMDLYCGTGKKGLQEARKINRFGRLWLMLPKER